MSEPDMDRPGVRTEAAPPAELEVLAGDVGDPGGIWDPAVPGPESLVTDPELMPEPPPEIREAARSAPDHWFYLPDPNWEGDGVPPAWAVLGRWRADETGTVVAWQDNDAYRPSPEALGWAEPVDALDRALQWAATGYGPAQDLAEAIAALDDVAVLLDEEGEPRVGDAPDGLPAVTVVGLPAPDHSAAAALPAHRSVSRAELSDLLAEGPGRLLLVSLSSPVAMVIEAEALEQAGITAPAPEAARPVRTVSHAGSTGSAGPVPASAEEAPLLVGEASPDGDPGLPGTAPGDA
ncbi:type VII secretion system-associated protein [Streptomyces sp. YS415]|uniref:type VII secretion system-associated protein n=1 Tax=Streptomyces sp. YS415 TaxID=2944806 RepID=UPI002021AA4D|nr:type VII secretion system-associated protein [Streptomyces sp. YS415]MCL7429418.1 type VII secretion system-associated protein [Streptomyces sp. YS415]